MTADPGETPTADSAEPVGHRAGHSDQGDAENARPLRLAELIAAVSLATDLANGQEPEQCLRIALLGVRLCTAMGAQASLRETVYWGAALRYIGCTAFSVEEARFAAGNDIGLRASFLHADVGQPRVFLTAVLRDVGRGAPLRQRAAAVSRLLGSPGAARAHGHAQCDAAVHLATKLGMPPSVIETLAQSHERFDGRGHPAGLRGEDLHPAARIIEFARVAVLAHLQGGASAVPGVLRARAAGQLDPDLVAHFADDAAAMCEPIGSESVWEAFLDAEPMSPVRRPADLRAVLEAFAQYADMAGGYANGHSPGVGALVRAAAQAAGMSAGEATQLSLAALVHDLGRTCVPTGLWDKPSRLTPGEWERVQLHAYFTGRILNRSPVLRELSEYAAHAHERLDGGGYPRGDTASRIAPPARLLAAADAYQACTQARPYRPALDAGAATRELRADCEAGRLCARSLDAVLAATAGTVLPRPRHAGPLTEREIEVLRLLARGSTNKTVGRALGISPRTVQHHAAHIYGKIGVNSRAGAALYAVEQGLLS